MSAKSDEDHVTLSLTDADRFVMCDDTNESSACHVDYVNVRPDGFVVP